jgi:hypothetical protein
MPAALVTPISTTKSKANSQAHRARKMGPDCSTLLPNGNIGISQKSSSDSLSARSRLRTLLTLLDVGFGGYSQAVSKLAGLTDRNGEHTSNGRDAGLQLQGDFLKVSNANRYWLHYQIGVFNGQGTNQADKDDSKDLIGGFWVSPIENLRIGAFGWTGHSVNENYKGEENTFRKVDRNRWSLGVDYESNWVFRSEFISSEGSCMTNAALGNKSDAWYALCGVPIGEKFKIYGRWDCYRPKKEWQSLNTNWDAAFNYRPTKNFILQATLSHTDNRMAVTNKHYNSVDLQVYVRF